MSELQVIETTLAVAARRRRLARALRGLWTGALIGSVLWLIALAVFKLAPIPSFYLFVVGIAAAAGPVFGFIIGGWRKPTLAETARWVDVKQNLKERMSTALEFAGESETSRWEQLVLADAASHAQEIDAHKLVPLHLSRATRWTVLILALAAGLGFVPELRSKSFTQKQADAKVIKEAGKQIADLTRKQIQQRPPALEQTQKSLESVAEMGDKLQKATLTRSEALKDLASASDKLKQQVNDLAKDPALKKMEQAARQSNGDSQTAAGLQKQIDALQKQLANSEASSEKIEKLQNELQKLQEAAKGLADKSGAEADADKQKLAAALANLSQEAQQAGVQLPEINDAIEALAASQTGRMLKDLDVATMDLEKLKAMKQKLEAMQAQAEKMGKDLAEQLKNGQAEAAADTLKKMSDQMKAANLSPEQMKKILDEVAKALPESKDYGKVEDLLKQAGKQGQKGDKEGAANSLADAANELNKLMQQMQDAQGLMASLDNLDKASQCVGSCQGWGMCKGKKGGFNPFGKQPGGGVGTWGAEGGEWQESGDWTAHNDNSQVNRPDSEGKGLTDRAQNDLSGRLTPDKVKGQFSPGGQMPSITLKGVSIKGQSKVQYEEASTAAQSDAQAALSQEKVPRAYQGAVKDYFDDLKK
ncbi:MAG: hypothetical protein EPO07_11020 [Verrucomicrobia bacterium]|nr:MAG: hypothetical protein EPO07_11020 [Verrucomicrobiota bacterium]